MTKEILHQLIDEADDIIIPIAGKVLASVFEGKPWKLTLSRAERDTIANYSQKRFDAALARAKGTPKTE